MTRAFNATHTVPHSGLRVYAEPDPAQATATPLEPGVDVFVMKRSGDWAQMLAANGSSGWVDARQLIPRSPDGAAAPAAKKGSKLHAFGVWITSLGGALVAASASLPWFTTTTTQCHPTCTEFGGPLLAYKAPFSLLFAFGQDDKWFGNADIATVGLALTIGGLIGASITRFPSVIWVRRSIGAIAVAVAVLFTVQMAESVSSVNSAFFAALGGGLLLMFGPRPLRKSPGS